MNRQGIINFLRDLSLEAVDQPSKVIEIAAYFKDLEKVLETAKETMRETLVREVQAHGKQGATKGGYLITYNPGAGRWHYNGDVIQSAKDYMMRLQEAAQLANRFQKPVKVDGDGNILTDGEGVEIPPAHVHYDKEGVKFTKVRDL